MLQTTEEGVDVAAANEGLHALDVSMRVAVIGAGAMGSGIAHVAARAGHQVLLFDTNADAVVRGKQSIEKDLRFLIGKGKLDEAQAERILQRVVPTSRLEELRGAALVIEAVLENLEVKRKLFADLEAVVAPDAVLATNTSSLSITAIAAGLLRPARFLGLHFFNPAPRMALVEVVGGLATDSALAARMVATMRAWGKEPVQARSTPGFIVNRVARPYYAEALRVLDERAASIATLDALLREACRFPMGPFELMDLIGNDVNFAVTKSVYEAYFGDKRFTPSLIQQELVHGGRFGRKSGRGFYDYAPGAKTEPPAVLPTYARPDRVWVAGDLRIAAPLVGRIAGADIPMGRLDGSGHLLVGDAILAMSDGRTATARAADQDTPNLVLFDLVFDYATAPRIAVSRADQCSQAAFEAAVGALQCTGFAVSQLDDVAGLIGLRTVCMLANEAADAVLQGIASARDVDTAMCFATNYPRGPLAWADAIGIDAVVRTLANLRAHYGEERYRVSPQLARLAQSGARFHE